MLNEENIGPSLGLGILLSLAEDAIRDAFGEEAAETFLKTVAALNPRNQENTLFWNLMENSKEYDWPADIRRDQEKAEDADPILKIRRLTREGKMTPEIEQRLWDVLKEFDAVLPKYKAKKKAKKKTKAAGV